jgi:hypothetical protein
MLGELQNCTDAQLIDYFYRIITRPGPVSEFSHGELDQIEAEEARRLAEKVASL